jgi:FkbH-like protein
MKLAEALAILGRPDPQARQPLRVFLACGFTPLHLQTFLGAYLRQRCGEQRIAMESGLFGDCLGNVVRLRDQPTDRAAIVIEWADLDGRLSIRQSGGWAPADLDDILHNAPAQMERFLAAIAGASENRTVAVALPTLPLPPASYLPGWQAGAFQIELQHRLADFARRLGAIAGVRLLNLQRLDLLSPLRDRFDVKAELQTGFPYRLPHADALGELLARLLATPLPKKGLITDLDNTLWAGILGEVGPENVHWDLEHRAQVHGLYQQLLASLAHTGILIAVASKNDPARVQEVFGREDLLLRAEQVFPVEAHWRPKSESVGRILQAWNIAADSVVFIDDSPLELAEVQSAYPELECLLFPTKDEQAGYDLLHQLRDRFGKAQLGAEDQVRLESLRQRQQTASFDSNSTDYEAFLRGARAEIVMDTSRTQVAPRALELVNKTNQFNLNGRRYSEGEWQTFLKRPDSFLMQVSYKDKFGPLGTITVLAGRREGRRLHLATWVMSCRAFSRRIENCCLAQLFPVYGVDEVLFDYQPTPKNGPTQEFLTAITGGPLTAPIVISRQTFARLCPPLYHKVRGAEHER